MKSDFRKLITDLFPICRSITGNGVRETLNYIRNIVPIDIHEVPTGTTVLDWEVPKEWNISSAYIKDSTGTTIVDFQDHNLHVLNYSIPIKCKMSLDELKPHLYSLPEQPDLIPYKTSYYNHTWGFCLSHNQLIRMKEDQYEVEINSTLADGFLTYGEFYIPGKVDHEVLLTTHICHPSLCNDNLSGIGILSYLGEWINSLNPYYSYRLLFIPGTIGSITWLARNEAKLSKIKFGLVLALLGMEGPFTYKKSRLEKAPINRIIERVFGGWDKKFDIIQFEPYGYDERQFCSPGFDLPIGNLSRTPYAQYPEYHTSADSPELVKDSAMLESFEFMKLLIKQIESEKFYLNTCQKGEPQLGRRGLYSALGGSVHAKEDIMTMLWLLNFSDGYHSLNDIAVLSSTKLDELEPLVKLLEAHDLLKRC